ncbi:unnamed protein product, partial [Brenthis ino]
MVEAVVDSKREECVQTEETPDISENDLTAVSNTTDPTYVYDGSSTSASEEDYFNAHSEEDNDITEQKIPILPAKRERRQPDRYGYSNLCAVDDPEIYGEITYDDAVNGPENEKWKEAMDEELKAFDENNAWEFVDAKEADRLVKSWLKYCSVLEDYSGRTEGRTAARVRALILLPACRCHAM